MHQHAVRTRGLRAVSIAGYVPLMVFCAVKHSRFWMKLMFSLASIRHVKPKKLSDAKRVYQTRTLFNWHY
jgi:hypothetical protein